MERCDMEGPEAALARLQSRPGMDATTSSLADDRLLTGPGSKSSIGRNDMALHLLGELDYRCATG